MFDKNGLIVLNLQRHYMNKKIIWPNWPQYGKQEYEAVEKVIKSNQLFAEKEVSKFEKDYSEYLGSKYTIGLGNATHGLHLALAALEASLRNALL